MRHHRSSTLCVTGFVFISLAGCAGGSAKSPSDTLTSSTVAQGDEDKNQFSGEVQERAVPRVGPGVTGPAGTLKPGNAPAQTLRTPNPITATQLLAPMLGQALPLPNYPAPTVNLAAVANAIRYDYKSLSTIVTTPSGLPLTKPVTISIGYFPSGVAGYGQYCQQRVTQTYATSTGNTFLCALPEGDGQPRRVHLDITLSEPNPAGGAYNRSGSA